MAQYPCRNCKYFDECGDNMRITPCDGRTIERSTVRKVKHWIYQNRHNEHKYLELKRYDDGHYFWRQYMLWDNGVKNYVGTKLGGFQRVSIETIKDVIMSYIWKESWDTDA